jgi:hypothetical protein
LNPEATSLQDQGANDSLAPYDQQQDLVVAEEEEEEEEFLERRLLLHQHLARSSELRGHATCSFRMLRQSALVPVRTQGRDGSLAPYGKPYRPAFGPFREIESGRH